MGPRALRSGRSNASIGGRVLPTADRLGRGQDAGSGKRKGRWRLRQAAGDDATDDGRLGRNVVNLEGHGIALHAVGLLVAIQGTRIVAVGEEARELLNAPATADFASVARDRFIAKAKEELPSLLEGSIAEFIRSRAQELMQDHARLRVASGSASVSRWRPCCRRTSLVCLH